MIKSLKKTAQSRESHIRTLAELYEYATSTYVEETAYRTAGGGVSYTYSEFRKKCDTVSRRMSQFGIGVSDKVAILSENLPQWAVAFFATVHYGRVSIPILPESTANEVSNILAHSESKVLFVSRRYLPNVSGESMDRLTLVIDIETFDEIKADESSFTCNARLAEPAPEDIATIIYTSGTTGNAKGVMLSHGNLISCTHSCYHACPRNESDRWLSILPMAHALEMTLGLLYPMMVGASVSYLSKPPVPSLLLKAMKEVRPTTVLSVPLIIEKIYRNSIIPTIRKSRILSWMDANMNTLLCRMIGHKLKNTFGGKITFFGIGGAKLDTEVERFLLKSGFPYAIGYGLTETSPLLSFAMGKGRAVGSIGIPARNVELKLYNVNPETGEGEIVAKGPNVMAGYYRDPQRTMAAFTEDGWFRTNDLAVMDEKGRFLIKGRLSNMILGASGENIYPEEIEQVINSIEAVNESLVVSRGGKLVALVNFNEDAIDWNHDGEEEFFLKLDEYRENILRFVNRNVKKTSHISAVQILREPFEKTATKKIRRFKYAEVKGV
ncbi:MAG: AMP-binding protein [Bacteroides sp.]|nr:AMP-binding protein [Bacteroides sp.]